MRRNSYGNGWLMLFGMALLLVIVLYGKDISNIFTQNNTSVYNEESFTLERDKTTVNPTSTTSPPAVEITTLPYDVEFPQATQSINHSTETMPPNTEKFQSTFADFIDEREQTRKLELDLLSQLENNSDKQIANEAAERKLELVRCMEAEITLRGLMLAKGYKDAIASVHSGSVNIAVLQNSLTESDVASLLELASRETGEAPEDIKIIPVAEE